MKNMGYRKFSQIITTEKIPILKTLSVYKFHTILVPRAIPNGMHFFRG
jgi:hypothetical protein